ncbi:bifunctional adenosylcobinamide kinase/adenosylcobinamide-phosphate guanylyltransferase [Planococcus lenghuensis]|uniref:Uncharacterized protein n=1 Tax=Planococcus lenghuensis TaxID=2213202 RepID=A0A1Q2L1H7_9BACL|nr:bifunctional adenosylcobinamide kinase/adenosylcobinamide-phosphate guanylyltransferase [Planococcus lenghuensis]AQQ54310.1 hypothetical protein B0X71_15190 [Planococcus lenghuensis]
MHIIFGGAYNGKREYVKRQLTGCRYSWYEGKLPDKADGLPVIAGVEQWIKQQLEAGSTENAVARDALKAVQDNQIWILTDLHRGIVPIDPLERKMRDATGRLYQRLFSQAAGVTRIWYGIPQILKGDEPLEDLYKNRR